MFISQPSTTASGVWGAATRTLTSLVTNVMFGVGSLNFSLAAGTVLDLRPGASQFAQLTISGNAQANISYGIYDGVTFAQVFASTSDILSGFATAAMEIAMKNTSAGALNVSYVGFQWH